MRKNVILLAMLLLCLSGLTGCVSTPPYNMFGIKVAGELDSFFFNMTPKPDGGFQYTHSRSSDERICAYATWPARGVTLIIRIYNRSKVPISTNYFGDEFSLITTDGTLHMLEKLSILRYPDNYINPNTYVEYPLDLPISIRGISKDNIRAIFCVLGAGFDETIICLKPIPETALQQAMTAAKKAKEKPFKHEMAFIKGGTFRMGSPSDEAGRYDNEGPLHEVTVSDFYMGKYEVTFAQYDAFCEATGRKKPSDNFWGRGSKPVIDVTWNDADAYCEWLSTQMGEKYRLPTEAEWEYACRAGTTTPFSFGSTISTYQANYDGDSVGRKAMEVGSFPPNAWGLYDMHGNVREWCSDWFGSYSSGRQTNPQGASSGDTHVIRNGSWVDLPEDVRSAKRQWMPPYYTDLDLGFRVCRSGPAG